MRKNKSRSRFRPLLFALVLFVLLSLTGCWSAKEIRNLATVSAIGVDKTASGEIKVTVVIPEATSLFPQTDIPGIPHSTIVTAKGQSIAHAISRLSSGISEELYFGHMESAVFGERTAYEEMVASVDFFKRGNEFRPNINLFVTKGSAEKLMKTPPQHNPTLGLALYNLVESNRFFPTGMVKDISQFTQDLTSNKTDPFTAVIQPASDLGIDTEKGATETAAQPQGVKNNADTSESEEPPGVPDSLSLEGTAVFKGGHLKGFLNERETRGLLWLRGKLKNEIVVLNCGENGDETASLDIVNSESSLSPRLSGGKIRVKVTIQTDADIKQLTCTDFKTDPAQISHLNEQFERKIKQEVTDVLNKAKNDWQADIFGFGKAINRNNPKAWKQLASQWRNGLLKNMEVELHVSSNISRYGLLKDPNKVNESR